MGKSDEINYITNSGYQKLKAELDQLVQVERPQVTQLVSWAAANGDRSENADYLYGKKRLREIDKRIRFLLKRLEISQIVKETAVCTEQVKFGATVTIEDETGEVRQYTIVGVDEIDLSKGRISWKSPIGSSLLNKEVGDEVTVKGPQSSYQIYVKKIEYLKSC